MSDDTLLVTPLGRGRYLVTHDGQRLVAHAVVADRQTWIAIGPHTFVVDRFGSSSGQRRTGRDETASLSSPMPATVTSLNVQVGDAVTDGDVLIVLEAMKMELPIKAPRDGRVKAIACREGELVQPGVPLLELE